MNKEREMETQPDNGPDRLLAMAGGAVLGVGMGYFLDPVTGAGRRARMRDKAFHALREAAVGFERVASDIAGRGHGLAPWFKHRIRKEHVDDEVLSERVRSKLGHYVSHPRALDVEVRSGVVTLRGPLPAREIRDLVSHIRRIPGVAQVRNRLEAHGTNGHGGINGHVLNGSAHPDGLGTANTDIHLEGSRDQREGHWTPAIRFAAGAMGASMVLTGLRKSGGLGAVWWMGGAALALRGFANRPLPRFFGIGAGRETVHLQKTLNIDAPPELVYDLWTRYEEFPRIMPHVIEVTDLGEGQSRWKIRAVPGASVEWVAQLTRMIPNEMMAWKSLPGSLVRNAGVVRFRRNEGGGTAVDIKMTYAPPAGALGHALAKLMGADPKHQLDRDLAVMKAFVERETRKAPKPGPRG
jgi:uncharacterized membrane protein